MKLNVGDIIEIGGQPATVCYETTYNNEKYICVAFEKEAVQYEFYNYKYEGDKLLVSKVEDPDEAMPILKIFMEEGIDEYGIPEELNKLLEEQK